MNSETIHRLLHWRTDDRTRTLGNDRLRTRSTTRRHGLPPSLPRNHLDRERSHRPPRSQHQIRTHHSNLNRHTLLCPTRDPHQHRHHSPLIKRAAALTAPLTKGLVFIYRLDLGPAKVVRKKHKNLENAHIQHCWTRWTESPVGEGLDLPYSFD